MRILRAAFSVCILLLVSLLAFAQDITGTIIDKESNEPIADAIVSAAGQSTTTDAAGNFNLTNLPAGDYTLVVQIDLFQTLKVAVTVKANAITALGDITLTPVESTITIGAEDIAPTVSLSESDLQSSGSQSISGLLTASRDVYINTAAFTFGTYRFNIRGYDGNLTNVYMNGVSMNDLEDGGTYWSQWGGLNDVMRNRVSTVGLGATSYTFGGVGGATNVDTRAAGQWDQLRVSYAASNRSYTNRIMATYSTGLTEKGWAVSLSGSRRWGQEGYVPGSFYDAWSYFMAVEKRIGDNHSLAFNVFGAPVRRGKMSPAVDEAYNLAGSHYYNPNWGYQNGEKRNSRVAHSHLPTFFLTHQWDIKAGSKLTTSAQYQFGSNGSTNINWYNAPDPRPDYYRNLPSYIDDAGLRSQAIDNFTNNPDLLQLDWDNLYNINYISTETIENYNGTGRDTTVNLSRYIVEDKRYDKKRAAASITYENKISEHFGLVAGTNFIWQRTSNYKLVDDLLGGSVFVDINQFAERDFRDNNDAAQNDLDNPNRLLKEGDRYGYDYNITVHKADAWAQGTFTYKHVDVFAAANIAQTSFWRTGNLRNGLFPDNSLGNSVKQSFFNYGIKGGATYKINGRNYLVANASYSTRAPFARDAFVSPRTRNDLIKHLKSEELISFEAGYLLKAPKVKARAMFYYTQTHNGINSYSLYYDLERTFVNIALSNISKRYIGGEFALEVQVYPGLSLSGVAGIGQHIYNSRQLASLTIDNSAEVIEQDLTIFSKNFFLSNGPQMASTFGINYRSPKYWFVSLNLNYFERIFIDINPLGRTNVAVDLLEPGSDVWHKVIDQTQADGQFTMDLFGGYSWKLDNTFKDLKRTYYLYLTVGINNILNNTDFVTGGFEQTRLYFDDRSVDRFPPKSFYAYGTTFFVQLSFRM